MSQAPPERPHLDLNGGMPRSTRPPIRLVCCTICSLHTRRHFALASLPSLQWWSTCTSPPLRHALVLRVGADERRRSDHECLNIIPCVCGSLVVTSSLAHLRPSVAENGAARQSLQSSRWCGPGSRQQTGAAVWSRIRLRWKKLAGALARCSPTPLHRRAAQSGAYEHRQTTHLGCLGELRSIVPLCQTKWRYLVAAECYLQAHAPRICL